MSVATPLRLLSVQRSLLGLPKAISSRFVSSEAAVTSQSHKRFPVTLIPGDGVGPELSECVQTVFKHAGVPVDFDVHYLSEVSFGQSEPLEDVVAAVRKTGICLKGHFSVPEHSRSGERESMSMQFKKELDLFGNVAVIKSRPGIRARHQNVDMVIVREQIEGEFSSLEHESVPGVVECLKIVTREESYRVAKLAFDYATKHGRKKVTAVHKANIMKVGDGLFLKCCQEVAELYPEIEFNAMIVDNCTMQMVSNPHQFDVMVMPNLYGNIIINLAAGLVGGAGVIPGEQFSPEVVCYGAGAGHSFSQAVGKSVANPTAILLASVNMLKSMNLRRHARIVGDAVDKTLKAGKVRTKDLGGHATTGQFVQAILSNIRN